MNTRRSARVNTGVILVAFGLIALIAIVAWPIPSGAKTLKKDLASMRAVIKDHGINPNGVYPQTPAEFAYLISHHMGRIPAILVELTTPRSTEVERNLAGVEAVLADLAGTG